MTSIKSVMLAMTDLPSQLPKDTSGTSLENLPNSLLQGNFTGIDYHSSSTKPNTLKRRNFVSSLKLDQ